MAGIAKRSFDSPDETRTPPNAKVELVKVGDASVGRATFQPGWRWSESIKPIAGTDSCQAHHFGVLVGGKMHVVHTDGTEEDLSMWDVYEIHPGHDAWTVGDEPAIGLEFDATTLREFAKE